MFHSETSFNFAEPSWPPSLHRIKCGFLGTSQSLALGVMFIVPDRSAATLLPIIQRHICSGTVIHIYEWTTYRRVQQLNYVAQHNVINHSLHFVDTASNTHTQNIESYWNQVKRKFKRMKGVHSTMLYSCLDEFMWRERHGRSASTALVSLCRDISLCYPV